MTRGCAAATAACAFFSMLCAAQAAERPPNVVELYNLVHPGQTIKKTGTAWSVEGTSTPATVDIGNGYLTFTDKEADSGATAALFITTDRRSLLADYQRTGQAPALKFYEHKAGKVELVRAPTR